MKKKILQLTFAINFIACISFGQITYSNYIDTTSQWNVWLESWYYDFRCNDFATQYSDIIHYVSGDTLFGSEWYYKIYSFRKDSTVCPSGTTINSYTLFSAAIREDSLKRIYQYIGSGEILIWDFNISIGDTVKNNCIVSRIDTVWLGSTPLKRFHCDCSQIIIEGVGATTGFFAPYFCSMGYESSTKLICYKKQNNLIQLDSVLQCGFQTSTGIQLLSNIGFEKVRVFPNPTESKIILELNPEFVRGDITIKLINSFGQTIQLVKTNHSIIELDLSTLSEGLYFLDLTTASMRQTKKIIKK